jgi:hypothetical protein
MDLGNWHDSDEEIAKVMQDDFIFLSEFADNTSEPLTDSSPNYRILAPFDADSVQTGQKLEGPRTSCDEVEDVLTDSIYRYVGVHVAIVAGIPRVHSPSLPNRESPQSDRWEFEKGHQFLLFTHYTATTGTAKRPRVGC